MTNKKSSIHAAKFNAAKHKAAKAKAANFRAAKSKVAKSKVIEVGADFSEANDQRKAFPFLKLPPEIRNMIYNLTMIYDPGCEINVSRTNNNGNPYSRFCRAIWSGIDVNLLYVNRQINEEASAVFYARNTIAVSCSLDLKALLRTDKNPRGIRYLRSGQVIRMTTFTGWMYPHVLLRFSRVKLCRLIFPEDLKSRYLYHKFWRKLGHELRQLRELVKAEQNQPRKTLVIDLGFYLRSGNWRVQQSSSELEDSQVGVTGLEVQECVKEIINLQPYMDVKLEVDMSGLQTYW